MTTMKFYLATAIPTHTQNLMQI